jgi:hypothetical protein
MKPVANIILVVVAFFAVAFGVVVVAGVQVRPVDVVAGAVVSIGAGLAGILPTVAFRRSDPVGVFQLALIGTVVHLVTSIGLAGAAVATHLVGTQMNSVSWLLGGYCVSLVALVWQLRRVLYSTLGLKA